MHLSFVKIWTDGVRHLCHRLFTRDLKIYVGFLSWTFMGRGLEVAAQLFQGVMLARYLGPKAIGVVALTATITGIIRDIFESRTWEIVFRFGNRYLSNNKPMAGAVLKLSWIIDLLLALLMFLSLQCTAETLSLLFLKTQLGESFIRINAYTLIILWGNNIGSAIMRMAQRYKLLALQSLVKVTIRFMFTIIFVIMELDLIWLFRGFVMMACFEAGLSWWFALPCAKGLFGASWWKMPISLLRPVYREIFLFSLVKNIGELVRIVGRRGNTLALGLFGSPEMAGFLKIAQNLTSMLEFPIMPMYNAAFAEVSRLWQENLDRLHALLLRLTFISTLIASTGFFILLLFGDLIIQLFFGSSYIAADVVLPYLALGTGVRMITIFLPAVMSVGAAPKHLLFSSCLTNGIHFTALLVFVPGFGLIGVGYSEVVMSISVAAILYLVSKAAWKNKRANLSMAESQV